MKGAVGDGSPRAQFDVESKDLYSYADQVHRAAEHVTKARDYLHKHSKVEAGTVGEWLDDVEKTHEKVLKNVEGMLGDLNKLLSYTSASLSRTADHYEQADESARDDLAAEDARLPRVNR